MKELKQIDYDLMNELMKDSHRSDRQLAKALGVSQPTVTRRRAMLEKNFIAGYTVIPKFGKIGFGIGAFTFIKSKIKQKTGSEKEEALNKIKDWYNNQSDVVLVAEGRGMGWDIICISLHEGYSDFAQFAKAQDSELSEWTIESQSFLTDMKTRSALKPFHLKYLSKSTSKK